MKKTFFSSVALTLTLAACGGGGGGSGGTSGGPDPLIDGYNSVRKGGYNDVQTRVTDDAVTRSNGCGIADGLPSRTQYEADVRRQNGTVTESTSTRLCASSAAGESCYFKFGDLYVAQTTFNSPAETYIDLYLGGLPPGMVSTVELSSIRSIGADRVFLGAKQNNPNVRSEGDCSTRNPTPSQSATDINGFWRGESFTYSAAQRQGQTAPATMTCTDRVCSISDQVPSYNFALFSSIGTWDTASGNQKAGAAISPNKEILTVYTCPYPLDENVILQQCKFYGFSR